MIRKISARFSGGSDGSIVQKTLALALATLLVGSVFAGAFAGSAAAGTAEGISAGDFALNPDTGDYGTYTQLETYNASSAGETETITYPAGPDYSNASASASQSIATIDSASVNADGQYEVVVNSTEAVSDRNLSVTISGVQITSAGSGEVTTTATSDTATVEYERQGVIELGDITTTGDSTAPSSVAYTVYNESGGEVATVLNQSTGGTVPIGVGNYTVDVGADGYANYTEDISVSAESTTTVSPSLAAEEPATGTIEVGEVTDADGNELNYSVDVEDSTGTGVASVTNQSGSWSATVDAGENYTVDVSAEDEFYKVSSETVSVSENTTSTVNFSLEKQTVEYDITVEDDGSALDSFDYEVYDGSSIADGESPIQNGSVDDSDASNFDVPGVTHGESVTVKLTWTDADGNEKSYTETITGDATTEDAGDGIVSETVDVSDGDGGDIIIPGGDDAKESAGWIQENPLKAVGAGFLAIASVIGVIAMLGGGFRRGRGV